MLLTAYLAGIKAFLAVVGGLLGFLTIPAIVVFGWFLVDRRRKRRPE
jgi:hypothetical protein